MSTLEDLDKLIEWLKGISPFIVGSEQQAAWIAILQEVKISVAAVGIADLFATEIKKFTAQLEEGKIFAEIDHWAIKLIAESVAKTLKPATNFVTLEVNDQNEGQMLITVQRKSGRSPAEVIREQQTEIDKLREENARLYSELVRD